VYKYLPSWIISIVMKRCRRRGRRSGVRDLSQQNHRKKMMMVIVAITNCAACISEAQCSRPLRSVSAAGS
ncbi:hypothetical protein Pmar_PMAR010323, partial [Perkinsus marinus ATCC 50983]